MASEERKNIHQELDELVEETTAGATTDRVYGNFGDQLTSGNNEDEAHDSRPSKANKKKRKRNRKKKKAGENNENDEEGGDTNRQNQYDDKDHIALPNTPLKYKLGSSLQSQNTLTTYYSYEDTDSSEDEGFADYKVGGYHPMHVGYVIIQKLGWGHFSTVWLAKDIHYNTYVALKIQRSAPHYLEAAFDEVEILDQVSSYWMKPQWLNSLKKYYKDHPEKLKHITGNDCYCVQLLNCLIHHGPHGKHFVMVFEILGVNLLEVIKRYNYKGVPMPLVRIMAKQCLMGLDYLHRVCKIIHTDLKPENVNLCLTEKEVQEIAERGQLTTTKMYHQPDEIKFLSSAARLDPKSFRGRKEKREDEKLKIEKNEKRNQKKKRKKNKKKGEQKVEEVKMMETLQTEEDGTIEREKEDTISPGDIKKEQQIIQKKKDLKFHNKKDQGNNKQQNNNQQEEKPKQQQQNVPQISVSPTQKQEQFSLRNLNPTQMSEVNQLLEQYVEVPRAQSLPKLRYIQSPNTSMTAENYEEFQFMIQELYKGQRYEFDTNDYEKQRTQLEEFLFYRKKFEQSQRAAQSNKIPHGDSQTHENGKKVNALGIPFLNLQSLDPRSMQQQIEEDKAKRRGPKLDENLRLKICDLGNGCWTYHHFSTAIQTRQYRSPEVIIGGKYGSSADMWSFACMIFEMATGDFLFEPRKGKTYGKDDDHLAQMMELLGRMPKTMALGGRLSKKFFDRTGHLRRIRGLNFWPLKKVLVEKYRFKEREAQAFADFLVPMLEWDPDRRASAKTMLDHPWLKMPSNYETKMSDEELQKYLERQAVLRDIIDEPMLGEEMSKLEDNEQDINIADFEDNNSETDLDDDSPFFEDENNDEKLHDPKQYRDLAEGKNLNNSFTGPYPESWDHLHYDKGANPQFQYLGEVENNIFELAAKILNNNKK